MNRIGLFITVMTSATLIQLGCGETEKPDEQAAPPETQTTQPASKPTTRSVLEEKRQSLALQVIPFRIDAPENWKIVTHEAASVGKSITLLEGKIIDSDIVADLSGPITLTGRQVKVLTEKAQKDAEILKKNGGNCFVRESSNMIFIDRRKMPSTTTQSTELPPTVEWRMFILVPAGIGYEQFEINCFDLSPEAYQKNADLIAEVFSTIRQDTGSSDPIIKP